MPNETSHLPVASDEMENHVREVFPLDTLPEEFAAKDGAGWMSFTFHEFRFKDPELDCWIHAVGKIITDPQALDAAQRKYLNDAELAETKKYIADDDDLEEDN